MFECPKCKSKDIEVLTETNRAHEVEALCLCTKCLTGFEYWKMWLEQKREHIDCHRIIKY